MFWRQVIQISLDHPDEMMKRQTPKEYTQGLGAASEALRRARTKGGGDSKSLLDEVRALLEPTAKAKAS